MSAAPPAVGSALSLEPTSRGKTILSAAAKFVKAKELVRAEELLRRADAASEVGVEGVLLLASVYDELGKKELANDAFVLAAAKLAEAGAPMDSVPLRKWGMLLFHQNKFEEAVKRLEESEKGELAKGNARGLPEAAKAALETARQHAVKQAPPASGGKGKAKKGKGGAPAAVKVEPASA